MIPLRPPRAPALAVVLAVCLGALAAAAWLAGSAAAQDGGTVTATGVPPPPALTEARALEIAQGDRRARDWVEGRTISRTAAELDRGKDQWTVWFMSESGGEETVEAQVFIADDTGAVDEVRTGPQVAWSMARGYEGAFGRAFTRPEIWLPLSALFLIPLLRPRRLISMRTLDLLALLSFGVSLVWFNRGEIFTSVPLAYPPMVYLGARLAWIGLRRRPGRPSAPAEGEPAEAPAAPPSRRPGFAGWCPTWLLVTLLAITLALRYGLNAFDSNVIDVGYAGVIGADRILAGATPYGTFPDDCASCDTYGPLSYIVYVPFTHFLGWSGQWDDLPAAHGAATLFDVLAVAGMLVLGWMLAGPRLGAALALAWAAFPFSGYALESNSNDTLVAALLVWGLVLAARPLGRGLLLGLAALSKFTPIILLPLWSRHPFPRPPAHRRSLLAFVGGLAAAAALTGWVLALDGTAGITAFWDRTAGYQIGRDSPFSLWGQHQGLRPLQIALAVAVLLAAVALARWPRRLDLVSMTALSGAVMIGLQLTMTHWFYLYIPWFLPFALIAMVPEWPPPSDRAGAATPPARAPAHQPRRAPVAA